jgi:uncharacterized cupin superfamily protein
MREAAMTPRILNLHELTPEPLGFHPAGDNSRYDAHKAEVSNRLGARKLGYNLTLLPPGKTAFPFHSHRVNEEMFLVIAGEGELRYGNERHPLRPGDIVACPPGGPESAHQISNTGSEDLRYLAVSTVLAPEIVEYPDSGKFGVRASGTDGTPGAFRFNARPDQGLDYWDGE